MGRRVVRGRKLSGEWPSGLRRGELRLSSPPSRERGPLRCEDVMTKSRGIKGPKWRPDEDAVIRCLWDSTTSRELVALLPGRTRTAISSRASKALRLSKGRAHRTPEAYFRRYTPDRPDGGCWLWTGMLTVPGVRSTGGYGIARANGRSIPAHRLSYLLSHGEIPVGMDVLHTCDVKSCVNPAHLYAGSDTDNQRDIVKRRQRRLVLTPEIVLRCRALRSSGMPYKQIEREVGVNWYAIRASVSGKSWRWLTPARGGDDGA